MMWRRGDVASIESPGRAAVLPLSGDLSTPPFVLEQQAAAVWQALSHEPQPESQLVTVVAECYGIHPSLIAVDVAEFLAQLRQMGLALAE